MTNKSESVSESAEIRFSHRYMKFFGSIRRSDGPDTFSAVLLSIFPVKIETLSEAFIQYDAAYLEGDKVKHYPLPKKGDYLLLLLRTRDGLITTLRRRTRNKEAWYRSLIGSTCICRIEETMRDG
jgi:hypothetical protein